MLIPNPMLPAQAKNPMSPPNRTENNRKQKSSSLRSSGGAEMSAVQLDLDDWLKNPRKTQQGEEVTPNVPAPDVQRYPVSASTSPRTTSHRSNLAFRRTLENYLRIAEEQAARRGRRLVIRMWTVTAEDVLPYEIFMKRWDKFVKLMRRRFPGFSCVRVVEAHPGESFEVPGQPGRWDCISHGLHMHFAADRYYSQKVVQQIANAAMLGNVSVTGKLADGENHSASSLVNYLSKYLRKSLTDNPTALKGRQLWSAINFSGKVGVRDIVTISRWKVVHDRMSIDPNFCNCSFKHRAKIAYEGEVLSRLVERIEGGFSGVLRMKAEGVFRDWAWSVEAMWAILQPSERYSRHFRKDLARYAHVTGPLKSRWLGVRPYLEWLNTPTGTEWMLDQKDAQKEADREREKERRRMLAKDREEAKKTV